MPKKIIFYFALVSILAFGLGLFLGTKLKSKTADSKNNTYQAGWEAAKAQLEKSGIGAVPAGMEIKTLSGTVDKVSGNTITLKNVSFGDPLADPSLSVRTVQINKDTKFYQLSQKDQAVFQKEMDEFTKKINEQSNNKDNAPEPIASPDPQIKKEITLADIKEGQLVSVSSNEDIKDKKEFIASQVSVNLSTPVLPGGQNIPAPPAINGQSGATSAPVAPPTIPAGTASKTVPSVPPVMPK
jgi:hypothetical protein